jgi:Fe2+ or Zn2+ uptake regulation protein
MHQETLTKTEVAILKFLVGNLTKSFTVREIAKSIRQDYRITYDSIESLVNKGIVEKVKKANINLCKISLQADVEIFSYIEYLRATEFFNRLKEIKLIRNDLLDKITIYSFTVILFGSYVKGTYKKHSDLDLIFLIPDKRFEKEVSTAIASIERISPIGIHETILSYDDFIEMLKGRGGNIAKEVLENHVIFYGAEAFYKLLKATL